MLVPKQNLNDANFVVNTAQSFRAENWKIEMKQYLYDWKMEFIDSRT